MFTGIIEGVGEIAAVREGGSGGRTFEVRHRFEGPSAPAVAIGDSVAHDGVCLTASSLGGPSVFTVEAGPETLQRTTAGEWGAGRALNLERAVTLETRLGGHLVQGHVDGVGRVRSVAQRDNAWDLWVDVDPDILRLVIPRGSVAVDGISLTVTGRDAAGFSLSIIPHTWQVTSLRDRRGGSRVNVEVDLMARYVAGLLEPLGPADGGGLTWARLSELGYGPKSG